MPDRRHTRQRQIILMTVKTAADGISADQVFKRVKKILPAIGRATIYRNLEGLVERGELYRFESEAGTRQYFGHTFHHVRFRCQRCGREQQLPDQVPGRYLAMKIFTQQTVFLSRLTAQGLCAACTRAVRKQGVTL